MPTTVNILLLTPVHTELLETINKKILQWALAGVAQWIEGETANQSVALSIPSQGTCLGCRQCPQ